MDRTFIDFMNKYNKILSQEYDIDKSELDILYQGLIKNYSKSESKSESKSVCQAILKTGKSAGKQCNKSCTGEYCNKHNKHKAKQAKAPLNEVHNVIIRNNPHINKLWHELTGFVFESRENMHVIGRFNIESKQLRKLIPGDIPLCKQWRFKHES